MIIPSKTMEISRWDYHGSGLEESYQYGDFWGILVCWKRVIKPAGDISLLSPFLIYIYLVSLNGARLR